MSGEAPGRSDVRRVGAGALVLPAAGSATAGSGPGDGAGGAAVPVGVDSIRGAGAGGGSVRERAQKAIAAPNAARTAPTSTPLMNHHAP